MGAGRDTVRIALLRAVNLPDHGRVAMDDLRALATGLGLRDVRTVLQTGNLLFRGGGAPARAERLLERAAKERLGVATEIMVRTAEEWRDVVARNPFPAEARRDPAHLVVVVCKEAAGRSLKVTGAKREAVRASGREIYVFYPDGIGRSRLRLSARGTARNWNTVLKLQALASGVTEASRD